MITRQTALQVIFAVGFCVHAMGPAMPQSNASWQIKMIVPVAPGGTLDFLGRLLAEQIGRAQGPTMLLEYRPGAGTAIATEAVSRAAPDGTTILFMANSFVIQPHLKTLSYDPLTGFEPICTSSARHMSSP